jgi:hypothetical protein
VKKEVLVSELNEDLDTFLKIYAGRPVQDNSGGMGFNHSFALWKMLTFLKPNLVVESGIWKGHGTWLIETTLPDAKIISFDLNLGLRQYISSEVTYRESDFQFYDWSGEDLENSVILFDDHQNSFFRIILANFFGFKNLIFDDNYTADNGDFYSLNHLLSYSGFSDIQLSQKHKKSLRFKLKQAWYLPVLQRVGSHQHWIVPKNEYDSKNLNHLTLYMVTFPRILQNDGSIEPDFMISSPDFKLDKSINESNFTYNNITYLKLR